MGKAKLANRDAEAQLAECQRALGYALDDFQLIAAQSTSQKTILTAEAAIKAIRQLLESQGVKP